MIQCWLQTLYNFEVMGKSTKLPQKQHCQRRYYRLCKRIFVLQETINISEQILISYADTAEKGTVENLSIFALQE
jgi:hypothetical protein